jgi:DNA-binding NarL/FixJ family response regulator
MSSPRSRVLIADDHVLVAELCKRVIEPEFAVVGIVTDGAALVSSAIELKPDVILVDIAMPAVDGLSAASQVKALLREVKIVHLTVNSDPEVAIEAFHKGASGYLLKTCAASELLLALRTVLAGRTYMSPRLKETVEQFRWKEVNPHLPREKVKRLPGDDRLTPRQREVLQLLAQGKNLRAISDSLEITPRTVFFHKYQMMSTLGLKSTAELVTYALRNGMIVA